METLYHVYSKVSWLKIYQWRFPFQEYYAEYNTNDAVITEKIYITNREEMVEAGNVTAIFDFETVSMVIFFWNL